ncbi:class I SAM-dependent methyltransferase [Fodinibius halophilus]|uniref:Class I SAM-dependent methyltransferase n=1 Tax=Fodinibius halophilus TaxID=1736908 RepID=A0A6M1STD7_9BACT|nr:class I SAM-dependent methyltransferase [Fodinibius halophilus]NGP87198.1 class I SAM-dependent methyltransferase [Fodinibius halophilus]
METVRQQEPARETKHQVGYFEQLATHVRDLRNTPPDLFEDVSYIDWSSLSWDDVNRPYKVDKWAEGKKLWEQEHGERLPVKKGWEHFNRSFHQLFQKNVPKEKQETRSKIWQSLLSMDVHGAGEAIEELIQLLVWNKVHRVEDAIWDPRGKRALFEGLDVEKPEVLFLGAADGYEAMQLMAQYPGGHAVLVDYDEFCKTERFGKFPARYPFLGNNPATGNHKVYYREDMNIDFVVEDIRKLKYGKEFDIVVSIGLIEHFPDEYKHEAFEMHRRFLKPGGYAILTTPRSQLRSKAFYTVMSNYMNYGYRELMDVRQMGLYAWENGFDILRAGYIKAHNGLICKVQ